MAQAYNLAGHDDRASFHAERCRAIAGSAGWREMEVDALNAMSVHYMHTGDLRRSSECAREAFDICLALGKTPTQHLGKLGLVSLLMGALPEAVDYLEQTLDQQRELANHSRAITLLNLGDAYRHLGRVQDAERSLHESIQQSEAVASPYIAAVARSTLVQVYGDTGRFAEAWEQARISRSALENVPDELARVQMWHAWGTLLMQTGDVGEAVKVLEAALNPARKLANQHPATQLMITLAEAYRRMSRLDVAMGLAVEAAEFARTGQFRLLEGHAMGVVSAVHLDAGRQDDAFAAAEMALTLGRETGHRHGVDAAERIINQIG